MPTGRMNLRQLPAGVPIPAGDVDGGPPGAISVTDARPSGPAPGDAPDGGTPVFADLSGRRPRRMKIAGIAAGAVLLACLAVMAAGLLGGPQASFIPWAPRNAAGTPAWPGAVSAGPAGASAVPSAAPSVPAPGVLPQPRASASAGHSAGATAAATTPATTPASAPATAAVSPSPSVTNAGGRTPPGRNRSPSPHPSPKHASAA